MSVCTAACYNAQCHLFHPPLDEAMAALGLPRPSTAAGSIWPSPKWPFSRGQCLDRRIPHATALSSEVDAWRKHRNTHNAKANWHFTTADARVKLKSLYLAL